MILQNQWSSSILNAWDGSLQINENDGTIMSTMVGAGKKNTNNTFSGVLMGDVRQGANDTAAGMGIYGYDEGIQAFGINVEGKAFLGKHNVAQLLFDGDGGTLENAGYDEGTGIHLELNGKADKAQYISIKSNGDEKILISSHSPYLRVKNQSGNTLLNIENGSYYLRSSNYSSGSAGTYINLESGYLETQIGVIGGWTINGSDYNVPSWVGSGSGLYGSNIVLQSTGYIRT